MTAVDQFNCPAACSPAGFNVKTCREQRQAAQQQSWLNINTVIFRIERFETVLTFATIACRSAVVWRETNISTPDEH